MKTHCDSFVLCKFNRNTYIIPHTVVKSRYTNVKHHCEISWYFSVHCLPQSLRNYKEQAKIKPSEKALAMPGQKNRSKTAKPEIASTDSRDDFSMKNTPNRKTKSMNIVLDVLMIDRPTDISKDCHQTSQIFAQVAVVLNLTGQNGPQNGRDFCGSRSQCWQGWTDVTQLHSTLFWQLHWWPNWRVWKRIFQLSHNRKSYL